MLRYGNEPDVRLGHVPGQRRAGMDRAGNRVRDSEGVQEEPGCQRVVIPTTGVPAPETADRRAPVLSLFLGPPGRTRVAGHPKLARRASEGWWALLESNQRPPPCEGDALPLSQAPNSEERDDQSTGLGRATSTSEQQLQRLAVGGVALAERLHVVGLALLRLLPVAVEGQRRRRRARCCRRPLPPFGFGIRPSANVSITNTLVGAIDAELSSM